MVFRSNSKLDQNLECCSLRYSHPITTKFCTHHVCKISLWLVEYILSQSPLNFGVILNSIEISLVGWGPGRGFEIERRRRWNRRPNCTWGEMIKARLHAMLFDVPTGKVLITQATVACVAYWLAFFAIHFFLTKLSYFCMQKRQKYKWCFLT